MITKVNFDITAVRSTLFVNLKQLLRMELWTDCVGGSSRVLRQLFHLKLFGFVH